MDIATFIGIVFGIGAILYGMVDAGVGVGAFINVGSMLVVIGGCIAALLINYPLGRVLAVMKVIPLTFQTKEYDPVPVVSQLIDMADQGVRKGPAALEAMAQELPDPFMQRGIELVAGQVPDEQIRYAMETELDFMEQRHGEGEGVVSDFAAFAPAFGMIGTLIGLVAMLQGLGGGGGGGGSAVEAISAGMAVALITTFYGAVLQNLAGLPIAGKLKGQNAAERAYKELVIEGVIMVSQGIRESLPPKTMADRLAMYLPPGRRDEVQPGGQAA